MGIGIIAHGRYVPENILDNKFFIESPNNPYKVYLGENSDGSPKFAEERVLLDEEKIIRNTGGIVQRRATAENETSVDMVEKAFIMSNFPAEELGGIVVGTFSNEKYFPSVACQIQERIRAKNVSYAVDLSAACSGFVHALHVAWRESVYSEKPVLAVGVDILTKFVDYEEVNCDLFGDGCGLVIVGETKEQHRKIVGTHFESDTSGICSIYSDELKKLRMPHGKIGEGGRDVMKKATRGMVDISHRILEKNMLTKDDVKLYIPHQANGRIIEGIRKRVSPEGEDRVYQNIQMYGNMSAGTVPFAFSEALDSSRVKQGELVMLLSAGAGLSLGGALVRI